VIPSVNTRFPGAAPVTNDVAGAADVHVNAVPTVYANVATSESVSEPVEIKQPITLYVTSAVIAGTAVVA